jgi:predicted CopG family antitoxin
LTTVAITASERRKRLKLKRIVISEHNYLALKKVGHAGDSFNDVISKLLRVYRTYQEKKQQQEEQQQHQESNNGIIGINGNREFPFPQSFYEMLENQLKRAKDT